MKDWKDTKEGKKLAQVIGAAWPLRHDYTMVRSGLRHLIRQAKLIRGPGQASGGKKEN